MEKRTIYLTFDDGIQEGTSDIMEVLKELSIKATFFLTGINTEHFYKKNEALFIEILSGIVRDHEIGNHSFSHANGFFDEYYSTGLLVNNQGRTISVVDDFYNNAIYFEKALQETAIDLSSIRSFFNIARLPGRNSWFYVLPADPVTANDDTTNSKVKLIVNCEADSYNAAVSLFKKGYNVIGWDEEWFMSYELHKEAIAASRSTMRSQEDLMACMDQFFPYDNMLRAEHVKKDRVVEDHNTLFERIMASRKRNIVLLMHDRAFRKDHDASPAYSQLYKLLVKLKQHQFSFGTISQYLMNAFGT